MYLTLPSEWYRHGEKATIGGKSNGFPLEVLTKIISYALSPILSKSCCKILSSKTLKTQSKCSVLVHWDDPEGWDREVGGEFRMGNTCKSTADSCQCMAKPTTIV